MFCPDAGNSKLSYALSQVSHFGDFENSVTFGVQTRILLAAGTEIFNTHKTGSKRIPNRTQNVYRAFFSLNFDV
jgi:hypothetical protein